MILCVPSGSHQELSEEHITGKAGRPFLHKSRDSRESQVLNVKMGTRDPCIAGAERDTSLELADQRT